MLWRPGCGRSCHKDRDSQWPSQRHDQSTSLRPLPLLPANHYHRYQFHNMSRFFGHEHWKLIQWAMREWWVNTLFPIAGESSENHVSCLSVWQWAKQEFMKSPFCGDLEKSFITFSILILNPASSRQRSGFLWVAKAKWNCHVRQPNGDC